MGATFLKAVTCRLPTAIATEDRGMTKMKKLIGYVLIAGGAASATPALAGMFVAPAPVVAAGIPALVAIGVGYVIARKRRND